jgi:hypothetical protein
MRLTISALFLSLGLSFGLGMLPARAEVSDVQVGALVEALRQAAPQTGRADDGLYSEWQIKPENIPRWSRLCIDREMTPTQFENSPVTARAVLICVMRDVFDEEYQASGNNESLAVRRAAAWWMTGDPNQYESGNTADYTQRVLSFYQQERPSQQAATPQPQQAPQEPQPSQQAAATPGSSSRGLPVYDRYMQAGYAATESKDYGTALLYFRRALDERPNDTYAEQAIRNVERYQQEPSAAEEE